MPITDSTAISDLWMDPDTGEPQISADGDFLFAEGPDVVVQSVIFRLKTVESDWVLEPAMGASLESCVGLPNSEETAQIIESLAIRALTHDGFLSLEELVITTIPVNSTTISLVVQIQVDGIPVSIVANVDLRQGQVLITSV